MPRRWKTSTSTRSMPGFCTSPIQRYCPRRGILFRILADTHYRVHLGNLPVISGFVGESLTTGRFLFPSVGVVQDRNTYDTILNGGITPILHFGSNTIAFNGGLQFTIRRDTISPVYMSQNLFRQFLYLSTSSFFNWVSFNGSAIREAGPFTDQNLNSRDASASLEFTVGRPWGHTSLLTGYSVRDLALSPPRAGILQYVKLCRTPAQVRQPADRSGAGGRSAVVESARDTSMRSQKRCCLAPDSSSGPTRAGMFKGRSCFREGRDITNTITRRANFWFPTLDPRVQL